MTADSPIRQLIDEWPTRRALADEVGAQEAAVHKWARHGRIPVRYQAGVVAAARIRGLTYVTPEWMLAVHATAGRAA